MKVPPYVTTWITPPDVMEIFSLFHPAVYFRGRDGRLRFVQTPVDPKNK